MWNFTNLKSLFFSLISLEFEVQMAKSNGGCKTDEADYDSEIQTDLHSVLGGQIRSQYGVAYTGQSQKGNFKCLRKIQIVALKPLYCQYLDWNLLTLSSQA